MDGEVEDVKSEAEEQIESGSEPEQQTQGPHATGEVGVKPAEQDQLQDEDEEKEEEVFQAFLREARKLSTAELEFRLSALKK
jgi:hypothetical protein